MKLRKFNDLEQSAIIGLAQRCITSRDAQPLIDFFNKTYRTKFENNGNTISDTIINKYYPDCSETMRDNLHDMMLQFIFDFEYVAEEGEKQEQRREDKEELRAKFRDFFIFHNDANKNTISVDEYFDKWYDEKVVRSLENTSKKSGKRTTKRKRL